MTALPASGYLSDNARTEGEVKQGLEDLRDVAAELPGGGAETTLTIATGSVTPTGAAHAVDTEAGAASDDLTHIDQTNTPDGRLLLLRAADPARVVTVRHQAGGSGQIGLADGVDLVLDETTKWLLLKRTGTLWEEVLRSLTGVYDVPFIAGWGADGAGEDLAVQTYGAVVLPRKVRLMGEVGRVETTPTGADLVLDVLRNGVSIYTTKPKVAAGATALTTGVLATAEVTAAAGDLLAFSVTQVGSTAPGRKLTFALKARLR